jgi:hypothetical protein
MEISTIMTIFVILGALGVVSVATMGIVQNAEAFFFKHHGCDFKSNGFKNSDRNCFHFG